jgi:hypothetical protein
MIRIAAGVTVVVTPLKIIYAGTQVGMMACRRVITICKFARTAIDSIKGRAVRLLRLIDASRPMREAVLHSLLQPPDAILVRVSVAAQ